MKEVEISAITIKDNVRTDYGDLTELTASIKKYGVKNPLEIGSNGELVDGHRRLKAATAAGLKVVPYFVSYSNLDKSTSQILSGIFGKNLNAIEEGLAFKNHIFDGQKNVKCSEEVLEKAIKKLSERISKTVLYIKRRLALVTLPKDVQEALIKNKILLGHALLLSKLSAKESSTYLREIITNHQSVGDAKKDLEYADCSMDLANANFDTKECKGCMHNGAEQTELFDTGKILTGQCLNKGCFIKKLNALIKALKTKYKDVLVTEEPTGYWDLDRTYGFSDNGITKKYIEKCRKTKDNYKVMVKDNGELDEYVKIPGSKKTTVEDSGKPSAKESLLARVTEFKQGFLQTKCSELMKQESKPSKILTILALMGNYCSTEMGDLFKLDPKKLDERIILEAKKYIVTLEIKDLIKLSTATGVDMKKDFIVTKEFLDLHTIDQLKDLAKEFKIDTGSSSKKTDLVDVILKNSLGKVPKEVL